MLIKLNDGENITIQAKGNEKKSFTLICRGYWMINKNFQKKQRYLKIGFLWRTWKKLQKCKNIHTIHTYIQYIHTYYIHIKRNNDFYFSKIGRVFKSFVLGVFFYG